MKAHELYLVSGLLATVIINDHASNCISELIAGGATKDEFLTVFDNRDSIDVYIKEFSSVSPRFTLCPEERLIKRTVKQSKVLFEDKFIKQQKNADYLEDEFFTENHLYNSGVRLFLQLSPVRLAVPTVVST